MSGEQGPRLFQGLQSTGQQMVAAEWLDLHFEASRRDYEIMLRSVGIQPGWSVLDAGVGSGSFLPLLDELVGPGGRIYGLDLASDNVAVVRRRLQSESYSCPIEVRQGSILSVPYDDNAFDAVWCANVLQYLSLAEIQQALGEFKRVLRPGGHVAIKEFDSTGLYFGPFDPILFWHLQEAIQGTPLQAGSGALFTVDLVHILSAAGLDHIQYKTFVTDRQHPLSDVESAFMKTVLRHFASLAEQAMISEAEKALWRDKIGDFNSEQHIFRRSDFYAREVHGVVVASVMQ